MDEKVINFIEFWNELRDIYAKEYPEAYQKYDLPDGETMLSISEVLTGECSNIKEAVEKSCVSSDTYENIKNIIRSGKLDHKIAKEDKQQILEDKWGKQFEWIAYDWFSDMVLTGENYDIVRAKAEKFVQAVKSIDKEKQKQELKEARLKEEARRLAEQKKAEEKIREEAEKKRQAEFERRFREEDELDEKEANERHEEQKELKYLKAEVDQHSKSVSKYLKYEAEVAEREAEREKRRAAKLEEEKSWSEEYLEEVKRRREIYRQKLEKEEQELEEQSRREWAEREEKEKREAAEKVQKCEKLKNDLKDWLSDSTASFSKIKKEMEDAQKQYEQDPEKSLEWAMSLAKARAGILGLRNHTRFGLWMKVDVEKLEYAAGYMPTEEAEEEFTELINQGNLWMEEQDVVWERIYQETGKLPEYMQNFVEREALDMELDTYDNKMDKELYKKIRDKAREERFKEVSEKYQLEIEEKRKKEEAERKRLEEERKAAEEKKRREEEAAEKKRLEDEAAEKERKRLKDEAAEKERKRLEDEAAEKKRIEEEKAERERQRLAKIEADKKRLEQEKNVRNDIFEAYHAVKDTKDRNILKKHTKFADMMGWLQAYENTFAEKEADGAIRLKEADKAQIADLTYQACLTYLQSHLETGKKGSSLDGQGTTEGILRKQAVVQILENMKKLPEFKDKLELQDIARLENEAQDGKPLQHENQRERINFEQLKSSLASKSKINRLQPYADLEEQKKKIKNMGPKKK